MKERLFSFSDKRVIAFFFLAGALVALSGLCIRAFPQSLSPDDYTEWIAVSGRTFLRETLIQGNHNFDKNYYYDSLRANRSDIRLYSEFGILTDGDLSSQVTSLYSRSAPPPYIWLHFAVGLEFRLYHNITLSPNIGVLLNSIQKDTYGNDDITNSIFLYGITLRFPLFANAKYAFYGGVGIQGSGVTINDGRFSANADGPCSEFFAGLDIQIAENYSMRFESGYNSIPAYTIYNKNYSQYYLPVKESANYGGFFIRTGATLDLFNYRGN